MPNSSGAEMAAPKGNRFWEARSSHGRKPIFPDPDALWDACTQYFHWVEENPLWEDKLVTFQGLASHEPLQKMRAMTLDGLQIFLDISDECWRQYRERKDFIGVVTRVEKIIRGQKFAGAAADLLNANIIARDLGLSDKTEHSGPNGGPMQIEGPSDREFARWLAFKLASPALTAPTIEGETVES